MRNLKLGTAPDSWGVWFPADPRQVPWTRFLDEAAEAGYRAVELGPFGYLPAEPERLRQELSSRGLTLTGGAVGTHLHRGGAQNEWRPVAELLAALGAADLITLPAMHTDLHTGARTEPAELTDEQWATLCEGHNELGRILRAEYGIRQQFHPHADTHVDRADRIARFLDHTDPDAVSLCLDTGHVAYTGGDNRAIVAAYPDRVGYVHLKSVDPAVMAKVRAGPMSFAEAVRNGAMTEPDRGEPDMPPLLADLDALGRPLWAVVEHDMYPAPEGAPLPIATRTRRYYRDQISP